MSKIAKLNELLNTGITIEGEHIKGEKIRLAQLTFKEEVLPVFYISGRASKIYTLDDEGNLENMSSAGTVFALGGTRTYNRDHEQCHYKRSLEPVELFEV